MFFVFSSIIHFHYKTYDIKTLFKIYRDSDVWCDHLAVMSDVMIDCAIKSADAYYNRKDIDMLKVSILNCYRINYSMKYFICGIFLLIFNYISVYKAYSFYSILEQGFLQRVLYFFWFKREVYVLSILWSLITIIFYVVIS